MGTFKGPIYGHYEWMNCHFVDIAEFLGCYLITFPTLAQAKKGLSSRMVGTPCRPTPDRSLRLLRSRPCHDDHEYKKLLRKNMMNLARIHLIGISKSGLWYQKKKLAQGKMIKVYGKVLSKLHFD